MPTPNATNRWSPTRAHTHPHTTQAQRTGEPPLRDATVGAREGQGSLRTRADFLWEAWRLLHTYTENKTSHPHRHTYIPEDTHTHTLRKCRK